MKDWRAITVRNPWAWAIAQEAKVVENRTGGVGRWEHYDGPVMIHAGMGWSDRGERDPRVLAAWQRAFPNDIAPRLGVRNLESIMHPGEVVATCAIHDVHLAHGDPECCAPWGEARYLAANGEWRNDITHLVLTNITPVHVPIRVRGRLGLWRPEEHIAHLVEQLLEAERNRPSTA